MKKHRSLAGCEEDSSCAKKAMEEAVRVDDVKLLKHKMDLKGVVKLVDSLRAFLRCEKRRRLKKLLFNVVLQ